MRQLNCVSTAGCVVRHSFDFMSTGVSLSSTETRLPLQVYVSVLLQILKCLHQIFMKRERPECMYKARTFSPTLTIALYWVYACIH
jgi:hypothetical protein